MTKLKERIVELLKDKEKLHLKEIYGSLDAKPASIRGTLNLCIKKNDSFKRLGKGFYSGIKINEETK